MKLINNKDTLLGDDLKNELGRNVHVQIAASFFSIYAFEVLKTELEKIDELQFIFTSPTFASSENITDKIKKERREFFLPQLERENSIYGTEFEIRLKNKLTQKAIARECADWIRSKVSFKTIVTDRTMPNFVTIRDESGKEVLYNPVNGLTTSELGYENGNSLFSFVQKTDKGDGATRQFIDMFNAVWNDSEQLEDITDKIVEHISTVYKENSPEFIYYLILYNIFNEFLEDVMEDYLPNDLVGYKDTLIWHKLYNFQKDAVVGIINKLEKYNGCILADSVGLGKTFSALGVIKYYEMRNKNVLVLCPKKLVPNWQTYRGNYLNNILHNDKFRYDILNHTDLNRTSGESNGIKLNAFNWGSYDLVVIDESHNFRNATHLRERKTRYDLLMEKVIRDGVKTKVLMLSATPVNNRFSDLKNQLALAYEGDAENLDSKIGTEKDINKIFSQAQKAFTEWRNLPTEERSPQKLLDSLDIDFSILLDSVTIARSRKHIEKYYDTKDIGKFPTRLTPLSHNCELTDVVGVMDYNELFEQLTSLKMAVYNPFAYIQPSCLSHYETMYDTQVEGKNALKQMNREQSLKVLMTINLLKRLESCVHSFRISLENFKKKNLGTVDLIDEFESGQRKGSFLNTNIPSALADELEGLELDDDEYEEARETTGKIKIAWEDMDTLSYRNDLEHDLGILDRLISEMEKITPEHDAKLNHLKSLISEKIEHPLNIGNKKVIVFTAFADTAEYLFQQLSGGIKEKYGIETVKIDGSLGNKNTLKIKQSDIDILLTMFSPVSKERDLIKLHAKGEFDLLIGTDCISEGQNLQDCDFLINYDIHWNPVRIIQRFGRIDRLGSKNDKIQLVNFWPDITLDEYINLKERVESRMVISNYTATGDDNVLDQNDKLTGDADYRREQLTRLKDGEIIDLEDTKSGVVITDLGLNDFRIDMVNFLKEKGEPKNIPHGMHAVVRSDPEKGVEKGVIFILKNINPAVNINAQNRLHPYYLVYVSSEGNVLLNHLEVKHILDILRTTCRGYSEPIKDLCGKFNSATKNGYAMGKYSKLLEDAIAGILDVTKQRDLDAFFQDTNRVLLRNKMKGLDDFELIAFVVVV